MHYFSAGLSSHHVEEEPFEPTAEIEARMIGNLLPDEDDLFSEVFNDFGSNAKGGENTEDFDLFSSIGGMELDGNDTSFVGKREFGFSGDVALCRGSSKSLLSSTNKHGPSLTGASNQCLVRRCRELENDVANLSKNTNDIMFSQSMSGAFSNGSLNGRSHFGGQNLLSDRSSFFNVSSAGDRFAPPIHSPSQDFVKFGGSYISSSEPHSLPDYESNLKRFVPYEYGSNVSNVVGSIALDRKSVGSMSVAGAMRQQLEPQGGIISPYGNATCPIHGHPWSNCYQFHQSSFGHKLYPNSPLLSNISNAPSPPHNSGFSPYISGSLGNMGPLSSFPLHPISRGSLSHSGLKCKKATNDVMNPSPQTAHTLGSTREIWRNLSRRRNQGNYSHANKKEFELDIERILRGEDRRTTLMLKNIPNKYSSKMLVAAIDEDCKGIYDFVYLPIDFKNNCNVGYAFINLIDPLQIVPFYKAFSGKKWEKFNSEKVAALAYGRIQGKAALIAHFQNSTLMNEDKRCRPVLFCTDGPNAGEQEPFPVGNNVRVKTGKARGMINEEIRDYHGSPSTSPNSIESDRGSLSPKSVID